MALCFTFSISAKGLTLSFPSVVELFVYMICLLTVVAYARYRYDMSVEEAAELARRAIYHATFRDGASGGVASGNPFVPPSSLSRYSVYIYLSPMHIHDLTVHCL